MSFFAIKRMHLPGVLAGVAYGLFARIIFSTHHEGAEIFAVMSLAFMFGVPIALGFLTVCFSPRPTKRLFVHWIFTPWLTVLAYLGCVLLLSWEGWICIIMCAPLVLILSSVGGVIAGIIQDMIHTRRDKNLCVAILAAVPFLVSPLEQLRSAENEVRTVNTQIQIDASAAEVWQQIKTVPLIHEDEQSFSFSHLIGFPRPLEAKLVGTGVGAVRYATFERGVLFVETVSEWDEPHRLSFSIRADTAHIPPATFDEHVTIGGKYFDVLRGTYWIEPQPNGVILHLSSEQRVSTRFNFYTGAWTSYLMADLQDYILQIIKVRCEHPKTAHA